MKLLRCGPDCDGSIGHLSSSKHASAVLKGPVERAVEQALRDQIELVARPAPGSHVVGDCWCGGYHQP